MPITEVPVFRTCPIHQNINTDPGQPTAVATWSNPTATDNTGGIPHVNCYPESGTAFPIGLTKVTCHAKSINGLVATCDFDMVVTGMSSKATAVAIIQLHSNYNYAILTWVYCANMAATNYSGTE